MPQNNLTFYAEDKDIEQDWSYATEELLDTLPAIWTRGLLYFLVGFVSLVLPWALFAKVDEAGNARGVLQPRNGAIVVESPLSGLVEKVFVKAGQQVSTGQALLELNSESLRRDIERLRIRQQNQQTRQTQMELLQSQLALASAAQQQQTQAQQQEQLTRVERARSDLIALGRMYELRKNELTSELSETRLQVEHSRKLVELAQLRYAQALKEVERFRRLHKKGSIAQIKLAEVEDFARERSLQLNQAEAELAQTEALVRDRASRIESLQQQHKAEAEQAKLRVQETERRYQAAVHGAELSFLKTEQQTKELETRMTEMHAQIAETGKQIEALDYKLSEHVIKAPAAGVVYQLPVTRAGAVVQHGELVAEVAPRNTRLILNAQMASSESASLNIGMPVKIKFDAYPYQDHGVQTGKLVAISPTSQVINTPAGQVAAYELDIELERECIQVTRGCEKLRPGSTASAEVIVGQRRIIDFVLDPFKKLQSDGLDL